MYGKLFKGTEILDVASSKTPLATLFPRDLENGKAMPGVSSAGTMINEFYKEEETRKKNKEEKQTSRCT